MTVVKHNDLNEASYHLRLDVKRLIYSAVAQLNPQKDMPDKIKIEATDFAEQWGIDKKKVYEQLKEAKSGLFDSKIKIRNEKSGRDVRWIYESEYHDGEGYVTISFSPTVKPYLCNLKSHFTSYQLVELKQFKSSYTIRLYEAMMQYKKNGWINRSIDEWRDFFGVEDGKYPAWYELSRRVIKPAIKEINQKTNYEVTAETKKRGRRISRLILYFGESEQPDMFK